MVNGRYFRSAYLHKAVMKAYEEMIPDGVTPAYFIFLETDPHAIDVNIHPTKTEIKFEDDAVIFQILYACVKETLGRNSFGASIDFNTEGAVQIPQLGKSFEQYKGVTMPTVETDPDYDPFRPGPPSSSPATPAQGYSRFIDKSEDYGRLFEEKTVPMGRILILQGKYILTPAASGLMIVHISRARERILYERRSARWAGRRTSRRRPSSRCRWRWARSSGSSSRKTPRCCPAWDSTSPRPARTPWW